MAEEQFLVIGEPTLLAAVEQLLRVTPGAAVRSVVRSGPGTIERLVVTWDQDRADALGVALSPFIRLEPDHPLEQ